MRTLLLTLFAVALGCSKADLPIEPNTRTTLQVTAITQAGIRIDSANVFVDGSREGFTPFSAQDIQPGLHALRVSRDGYLAHAEQLLVELGRVYVVEAILDPLPPGEGQLIVTVDQDSALVRVMDSNDNVIFETEEQTSVHQLHIGRYRVGAEKAGVVAEQPNIEIETGKTTVVNLTLAQPGQTPTLAFGIALDSVNVGEDFEITWESDGFQVIIDQGIGVRGPNGKERVRCSSAGMKIFTATAYSLDNLTTEIKDSVYISEVVAFPPSLNFSILADSVDFGTPAILEWQTDGHQVVLDHGIGGRGPSGSEEILFQTPGKKVIAATAYGENNLLTVKKDSVFVKEAALPPHPVVMLSTTRRVTVDTAASISWHSQNADYIVVDYVDNPGLSGSAQTTFHSPGIRIVTATAFNQSGYASASDTIEVVVPVIDVVDDILVEANVHVRANAEKDKMKFMKAATFEVEKAGRYEVVSEAWYNSGDVQRNESFFLDISTIRDEFNLPLDPNAGEYKVVPDEPGDPHTSKRASGIFVLSPGTHYVNIYHYGLIAKRYPQFINGKIIGPESVWVLGFKLIYRGN